MLNLNTYRQHKNYELERNKRRIKDVLWNDLNKVVYGIVLFVLFTFVYSLHYSKVFQGLCLRFHFTSSA